MLRARIARVRRQRAEQMIERTVLHHHDDDRVDPREESRCAARGDWTRRAAIGARPAGVEPQGERSRAKPELQCCATRELIRSCHSTSLPEFDPNPLRQRLIVRDAHLRRKLGQRGFRNTP